MLRNVRRRYPSRGKRILKKEKKENREKKKEKKKKSVANIITEEKGERKKGGGGGGEIEMILVFACKLCFINCQSYRLSATRVNENSSIKRKYNTGCFKERV